MRLCASGGGESAQGAGDARASVARLRRRRRSRSRARPTSASRNTAAPRPQNPARLGLGETRARARAPGKKDSHFFEGIHQTSGRPGHSNPRNHGREQAARKSSVVSSAGCFGATTSPASCPLRFPNQSRVRPELALRDERKAAGHNSARLNRIPSARTKFLRAQTTGAPT